MANVNQNKCGTKLLDDKEMVPDSSFSASSSFVHNGKIEKKMDLSPKAARENYDKDNQEFAWCPDNIVHSDLKEYLEIDMGQLTVINFAQTRGRFAQGAGKEFIPYYKLQYRREAQEEWKLYKKFDSTMGFSDIMKGPSDAFLDAYETLDPPIITRWIRLYPFSYVPMRVCTKLQLFGCKFENKILEYRIPQGSEPKKPFINLPEIFRTVMKIFQDSSYDGTYDQGLLNGGLGRLTDNKTGGNFMLSPVQAQHFVGWNRNDMASLAEKSITLWFRFDSVRNFSSVKLSGFENRTMKISHPEKVEAKFSIMGELFSDADTIVSSFPTTKSDVFTEHSSPWTQFNLQHRIGQFLQLKLYFQTDWILLSEIDFTSEKVIAFPNDPNLAVTATQRNNFDASSHPDYPLSHIDSNASVDAVYILTILLCLLVGIILAISVFWLVIRRKRNKRKKDIKKHELAFYSQNPFKTLSLSHQNQGGLLNMSNSYMRKYSSGSLQIAPRPSIGSQPDSSLYKHNSNPQNFITTTKQSFQANDGSIYTSIPGSDHDSSLSTDYMMNSGVSSSHPYAQAVPVSMTDFIHNNQPQIIGNPLAEYIDSQQFMGQVTTNGLPPFESDLLGFGNRSNGQSFSVSNGYQPIDYNGAAIDKGYFPLPRSYQGSPMRNDRIL